MYKTFINILLLVVLATQMFPVEQVGKILYSNQITEELPHCGDTEVVKKSQGYSEYLAAIPDHICNNIFQYNNAMVSDGNINFPSNHSKDIHNPPPNFRYLL